MDITIKGKDGVKVKRKNVKKRDIQDNIVRIKAAMEKVPVGSEEYEVLQKEMEQELTILKKFQDARFVIQPKDAILVATLAFGTIFFIGLDHDNPKALKIWNVLSHLIPFKL